MLKASFISIVAVLLVGCAPVTTMPMTTASSKQLANREIATTKRESPSFVARTAGKGMLGILGTAAMITSGNEIVKTNAVEDPANYIAQELRTALNEKYGSKNSILVIDAETTNVAQICAINPNADLILDVRTNCWAFSHFPTAFSKYRVSYSVAVRLIDNRTKTLLAEGFSSLVPDETPDAPTRDELLANQAARLKTELKKAADFCIADLKTRILLPQ